MEHLSDEALARLVDDLPGTEERRHLDGCDACQGRLEGLRAQSDALARLPDVRPPRGDWEALEARLLSEGLVDGGSRAGYGELARTPRWMRTAAAVLLFLSGVGAGALLARGGLPGLAGLPASVGRPVAASLGPALGPPPLAATLDEAADHLQASERAYIDAMARYRELLLAGGEPAADDPARRYAALDVLVQAGRAAVREAPADPFLNGILASALAEQQAVARGAARRGGGNWF